MSTPVDPRLSLSAKVARLSGSCFEGNHEDGYVGEMADGLKKTHGYDGMKKKYTAA